MTLLVIGGFATAGKDAVANFLVENHGWYKTYMSKPLETALLTLDPFVPVSKPEEVQIDVRYSALHAAVGYDESKKNWEVRRLLQTLGTEVGRNMLDKDIWLRKVCAEVVEQQSLGKNVVVTGVRYPNELATFNRMDAYSLWVHRPGTAPINSHSSENTLEPERFDKILENNGTLEDLENAVRVFNTRFNHTEQ